MVTLKVRKVGNSLGFTLPTEVVQMLRVREREELFLTEVPGGLRLSRFHPFFWEEIEVAEDFLRRYKNALREIAE